MGANPHHPTASTGVSFLTVLEEEVHATPGPRHAPVTGREGPTTAHSCLNLVEKGVETAGVRDAVRWSLGDSHG